MIYAMRLVKYRDAKVLPFDVSPRVLPMHLIKVPSSSCLLFNNKSSDLAAENVYHFNHQHCNLLSTGC